MHLMPSMRRFWLYSTLLYWNLPLRSTSLPYTRLPQYHVHSDSLDLPQGTYVRTFALRRGSGRRCYPISVRIASPASALAVCGWLRSALWRTSRPCGPDGLQVPLGCSAGFSCWISSRFPWGCSMSAPSIRVCSHPPLSPLRKWTEFLVVSTVNLLESSCTRIFATVFSICCVSTTAVAHC